MCELSWWPNEGMIKNQDNFLSFWEVRKLYMKYLMGGNWDHQITRWRYQYYKIYGKYMMSYFTIPKVNECSRKIRWSCWGHNYLGFHTKWELPTGSMNEGLTACMRFSAIHIILHVLRCTAPKSFWTTPSTRKRKEEVRRRNTTTELKFEAPCVGWLTDQIGLDKVHLSYNFFCLVSTFSFHFRGDAEEC